MTPAVRERRITTQSIKGTQVYLGMVTKPKRHHILPESYLHGFTRNGGFIVFDRKTKEFRPQTPTNTTVIGHYYAVTNKDGDLDYGIETMLSQFEGTAKGILRRLESRAILTPAERAQFAFFLALLVSRGPRFEREVDSISDQAAKLWMKHMFPTIESVEAHFATDPDASTVSAESFFQFIHGEEYELVGNRNNTIITMLDQAPKVGEALGMMNWTVLHTADRHGFITSDSPYAILLTEEQKRDGATIVGLGSPHVRKVVPLTRSMALLITTSGMGFEHRAAAKGIVREANLGIASESERFVIGADEELVRSIVRRSGIDRDESRTELLVQEVKHPEDPTRTITTVRRIRPGHRRS